TTAAPAVVKRTRWMNFRLMLREKGARLLGLFSIFLLTLSCTENKATHAQATAPAETSPTNSATGTAALSPASLTEEELRKLVHAKGGADRAHMARLLLSDGGTEQSARRWAPFALALSCKPQNAEETTSQLVTAVASWLSEATLPSFDHLQGATWAIGSCGAKTAESILRSWLTTDPS